MYILQSGGTYFQLHETSAFILLDNHDPMNLYQIMIASVNAFLVSLFLCMSVVADRFVLTGCL